MKKEIVFIHEKYPFGGGETVSAIIANGMTEIDSNVHVTIMAAHLNLHQINTQNSQINYIPTPITSTEIITRLKGLGQEGILILPIDPPAGLLEALHKYLPSWRSVFILHGQPLWQVKGKTNLSVFKAIREKLFRTYTRRYTHLYRQLYSQVDTFCVLCENYRDQLAEIVKDNSKIRVMYNPVELHDIVSSECDKPTVLYMGRLDKTQKRIDRLIQAWSNIHTAHPNWQLSIVGDGPDSKRLELLASSLGVSDSVNFCGYTTDPAKYYAQASIMALTSEYEGWPCMLLEGMQAGVVPIAMDCCGGVHEMLSEGRGILTPAGDVNTFAQKLSDLMSDETMRNNMRPALKAFAAQFSPHEVSRKWLALVNELTSQRDSLK